jgi:hypothetical protein
MQLKKLLEEQSRLFDEKFPSVESYSQRNGDYTEAPLPALKSFLTSSNLAIIDSIRKMIEKQLVPDEITASSNPHWVYNKAKKDIINNLEVK